MIKDAVNLSEMFVNARNGSEVQVSEENLKVALPFFLLNPQTLKLLGSSVYRLHSISFRLNSMRELYQCNVTPSENESFEDCNSSEQRLYFLWRDLDLLKQGQTAKVMGMHQYQQFMVDSLVILYARFARDVPLSTFITAAFAIGDDAVLALSFTFPHFICPLFQAAIRAQSKPELLVRLAAMSPSHRPLLVNEIKKFPRYFALFAIAFFPEEAPSMILSSVREGLSLIKDDLFSIKNKTQQFYLCYARCCASSGTMTEQDFCVFEGCQDEQLLVHLMATLDDSRYISTFSDRFVKNPETMATALDLVCDIREQNTVEVAEKIGKVLGDDIEWCPKTAFANHILKNSLDVNPIEPKWFGKGTRALRLIDSFREDMSFTTVSEVLPSVIDSVESVDFVCIACIEHFVQSISRHFCDKMHDLAMFARTIEAVLNKSSNAFDLAFIENNCCPAVLYLELILFAEERIARQDQSYPRFLMANKLPLRFVLNCAFFNPACSQVFGQLCGKCQAVIPHIFCQSELFGQTPKYLLSHKDQTEFLTNLEQRPQEVDEAAFTTWMVHRFVMPLQYVIDTIDALGGPAEFSQLQDAFIFPSEILHNKYCLKIVCVCMLDMLALYQELFPVGENKSKTNASLFLFLQRGIDLLKDPLIDAHEVCRFINEIFFTTTKPSWLIDAFLLSGSDDSLVSTIAQGVDIFLNPGSGTWKRMDLVYHNKATTTKTRIFLLYFASCAIEVSPCQDAYEFCNRALSALKEIQSITEENMDKVLSSLVRISKVFPDLVGLTDMVLERVKALVLDFPSKPHLMSSVDMAIDSIARESFP